MEERAIQVATGSSLAGVVVSSGVVEGLPLNGRNFLEFAILLPGNAPASDPAEAGFLRSSSFGHALTTAGGVFGSGGPRAFQIGLRARF